MKITPSQFSAFFKAKGATEICPFCGQDSWSVPSSGHETKIYEEDEVMNLSETKLLLTNGPQNLNSTVYIPTIALSCSNCGFVRLQHLIVLQQWLDQDDKK